MSGNEEAMRLLDMAGKDFRAATGMTDIKQFDDEVFGFHIEQAAEKALKAWLSLFEQQYPRTHDLTLLLRLLTDCGQHCQQHMPLVEFNAFAVQYRYEAYEGVDDLIDRPAALKSVGTLLDEVRSLVEKSEREVRRSD